MKAQFIPGLASENFIRLIRQNSLSFPKTWSARIWQASLVRQSLLDGENSLFLGQNSRLWLQKFPVPLRRGIVIAVKLGHPRNIVLSRSLEQ